MRVGVPKGIKVREYRVGLVPSSVCELVDRGHEVLVEQGAGTGIGMTDEVYEAAGAVIAASAEEVFERAQLIVKVKEPQAVERRRLKPGQVFFTYLHLAPDPKQAADLVASGATCIAYETITAPARPKVASAAGGRTGSTAAGRPTRRRNGVKRSGSAASCAG